MPTPKNPAQAASEKAAATGQPTFSFVGTAPEERPKRAGRGGRTTDPAMGNAIWAIIQQGQDVTDNQVYTETTETINGQTVVRSADDNARAAAIKAARALNSVLPDDLGKVAGTRIKDGRFWVFLTDPRKPRKSADKAAA